jgi:3-oxoacyl-[acyl-carrier-protein] synthase-3
MGTEIHMVSTLQASFGNRSRSAIRLSTEASAACLAEAQTPLNGVQQLIYSGIYRDKHIGEPSIASLIHGSLGKYLPVTIHSQQPDHGDFFCFDLSNGGCGLLQSIQLTDAFIQQRRISTGLGVAGDAPASGREKWMFPFTPAATAILLRRSEKSCGFSKFFSKTYPAYQKDFSSQLLWIKPPGRKQNQNTFSIQTNDDYLFHCIEAAMLSLDDFFSLTGTRADTFNLYITSVSPAGFSEMLGYKTGLINHFVLPDNSWGPVHTAGLGFGLRKAWLNGSFKKSENILFLAVGSGLMVSIAWYQKESGI